MGIEDATEGSVEPGNADKGKEQAEPARNSPPDRPGQPVQAPRAESRRAALEANGRTASRDDQGNSESATGSADQKSPEKSYSPLRERPSYGGFKDLDEEFEARAHSRGNLKAFNKPYESSDSGLNDKAIKEQIDPFGPDTSKAEGRKDPFQRTVKDKDSEWSDGVDRFDDLPVGEKLLEADEDERSRLGNLHSKLYENSGSLDDRVQKVSRAIDKAFGEHPAGHAEVRTNNGPVVYESHPSGIDAGSAASALLTLGIVGAEATRRAVGKIREWRELNDKGDC